MWSRFNEEVSSVKRKLPSLQEVSSKAQTIIFGGGPGLFLDIHQQCKQAYPKNYTGINLLVNKIVKDQVSYDFNITVNPSEAFYSPFNAYLGRETRRYYNEYCQIGTSCLALRQRLSDELLLSVLGHVQHVNAGTVECVLDYHGGNYTSSAAVCHENASHAELFLQHLHGIDKNLAIGAELTLRTSNDLSVVSKGVSLVGRFYEKNTDATVSGTLNNRGVQLCLYKPISSKLKIGTVLDVCLNTKSIVASVACDVSDKNMRLQTSIDTNGVLLLNVSTENFYKSENVIFKPTLSALMTVQKRFDVGIGLEILI